MNDPTHPEWHRLFNAALNGTLTDAERPQLAALLKSSAEARQLWFLYHDNECGLSELKTSAATTATSATARSGPSSRGTSPWFQWRSLTAAAAGLVIGLFGASVVYGIAIRRGLEKRTPLAVFEPGFEDAQLPLVGGVPRGTGQWGGDAAKVVASENGVPPKEGRFMLRAELPARGAWRVYQVLDLQSLLPPGGNRESREIEISASLATADAAAAVRLFVRVFAVTEAPDELDDAWIDRREEAVASAMRGLEVLPGAQGWQTISVSMQVPRTARSLVLFLGARIPDKSARTSSIYLDDVRVSLVTPP
jgi:hypothetical protein